MRIATIVLSIGFSAQIASADCGFQFREAQDGPAVFATEFAGGLSAAELRQMAQGDYVVVSCENGMERVVAGDVVGPIDERFSSLEHSRCIQIAYLYNSDRSPKDRVELMKCLGVKNPTQTSCISEAMQFAEDQSRLAATRLFNCLSNEKAPMPLRPSAPLLPVETTAGGDRSPPPG